jgi:CRP-like cAMP-binding protein
MEPQPDTRARERGVVSLSREQVRDKLRAVALFDGLEGVDLDRILGISETVLVEGGEPVFEEGERGDHFYVIVRGEVELRKRSGDGEAKLAVLREGQAFGEMALLNNTPRSASAHALTDTYMLSVSRAAFAQLLGEDTLSMRLLRNLSRALWATSVRLASRVGQEPRTESPHEALSEFNRLLRSRLLPRVTPRVSGFDLTASTLVPRQGVGSAAWDWLLLSGGRPTFVVMRALKADIFSAQRLAAVRGLLRGFADQPQPSLGALLTDASDALRSGWIDGLSGPVACAGAVLTEAGAEFVRAGEMCSLVVRADGGIEDLAMATPAVGEQDGYPYESIPVQLGMGDMVILLSERPADVADLVGSVVSEGYTSGSRDALGKIFASLAEAHPGRSGSDLTGVVVTRTEMV